MSVKIRDFLRIWIEIIISIFGVVGYMTQLVQFFSGRWGNPFYQEVFMLVLFFIFSLHMNRVIDLFKAFVSRIKKTEPKTDSTSIKATSVVADEEDNNNNVGGGGIDETNL